MYAYDAGNRRVWKGTYNSSGVMTAEEAYFYGVSGQKLGTYALIMNNPPATYPNYALATDIQVFFGGKRVGHGTTSTSLVVYATTQDRVGSVQNAGLYFSASSFYPYGEEKSASPGPNDQMKFATYARDSETGLDYAMNRYYSSGWGRFGSADPYSASGTAAEPQSWNRYSYAANDPVNRRDPRGKDACFVDDDSGDCCGDGYDCGGGDGGGPGCVAGFYFDPVEGDCEPDSGCPAGQYFDSGSGGCQTPEPIVGDPTTDCTIELFSRPTPSGGPAKGRGNHTYLYVFGTGYPSGFMIEGGPVKHKLTGQISPPGQGLASGKWNASNPFSPVNTEIGGPFDDIGCGDVQNLLNAVASYDSGPKVLYSFLSGISYNSNAFTYTLLSDIGLSNYFGHPGGYTPGWGQLVPGLTPP